MPDTYTPIADINEWDMDTLKWHLNFYEHHARYSIGDEATFYRLRAQEMRDAISRHQFA